jgi:hypothetical protein
LIDDLARRLKDQVRVRDQKELESVPAETKFIELALNIIDPDGAWDPEETLEFGDAARVYLGEFPITNWEIEGAFALVAQFVRDWALGESDGFGASVNRFESVSNDLISTSQPIHSTRSKDDEKDIDHAERMTLETEDPLSRATLRMMIGEFEGAPTLALFIDDEDPPIRIDLSALELAMGPWGLAIGLDKPVFSFSANADRELEIAHPEIDHGPFFE